jgi:hypothetical protein
MTIRGEWLRFVVVAALFFFVILGIPYLYRTLTSRVYSPSLHPRSALTGTWVGRLAGEPVSTAYQRDPYASEGSYRLDMADTARRQLEEVYQTRVVYLDLGLNPFKLGNPELRGKVRMCAYNGAAADFQFTTMALGDTEVTLLLTTEVSDEFGNLYLNRSVEGLKAKYEPMGKPITGLLKRGSEDDFKRACEQVRGASQAALEKLKAAPQP